MKIASPKMFSTVETMTNCVLCFMKSMLTLPNSCMCSDPLRWFRSDAERLALRPQRHLDVVDDARDEHGGEHAGQQADDQRHGEALDRPRAVQVEARRRAERGDVRVDDRDEDAPEAGVDRGAD